jgi:crotonobetaine/carnitine-CoA ligase
MTWGKARRDTVFGMLEHSAIEQPDKVALIFDSGPITYRQLIERSYAAANSLVELGIGPGDKVALLMENSPEQVYTLFGCAAIGAVELATNTAYRSDFLSSLLHRVDAKMMLVDASLAKYVTAVADDLPELKTMLVRDDGTESIAEAASGNLSVLPMTVLAEGETDRVTTGIQGKWDEPSSIQYTSGTTGPSKAALMSQNYMVNISREYSGWWYREPDDRFFTGLPMFHGLAKVLGVMGAVYRTGSCVIDKNFSLSGFWDRALETRATSTACPEAVLIMLWNMERGQAEANNTLRTMVGAPIPADLLRDMEKRWDLRLICQYSLSEASPFVVGGVDEPLIPGTSGKVQRHLFDVRIFNEDDEELPVGEVGEVVCRPLEPKIMFDGYCGDDAKTLDTWRNGWFHSGDLGKIDEDDNFTFADRKKDYIRRRAENISSFEVERAVTRHPAVAQATAVGVKSEFGEEEVKIFVILAPSETLTPDDLLEHCVEHIPYYAVPRYIEFVDDLPLTPSGKVRKQELRDIAITPNTWDCEANGYKVSRKGLSRPAST